MLDKVHWVLPGFITLFVNFRFICRNFFVLSKTNWDQKKLKKKKRGNLFCLFAIF